MKLLKVKGSASQILLIFVQDSSSSTGAGLTGLTNASSGLTAYYHRNTASSATAISLASMTLGTFTSGGFKEVDSANMPGWYQLGVPDAALATGADSVGIHLKGATNMVPLPIEIQLTGIDVADGVRGGMTALPNASAGANGGLPTGNASGQVTVGGYASGQAPLQPTVAGRTLDISAGGEAGVDWANVGGPTTVNNLSGTTIGALSATERNAVADALLDRTDGVESGLTLRGALRLAVSALAGKLSGAATTTVTIRNAVADSKARITATVDSDGNRSAITWDAS